MSSTPTVYFIDDSATMREVIKIAFRRENINVIACHDAATAFAEIEQTKPDVGTTYQLSGRLKLTGFGEFLTLGSIQSPGLIQSGLALLQQFAGGARPAAAGGQPRPGLSLVTRDERTGETYLRLPVPNPEVLDQALQAFGTLLRPASAVPAASPASAAAATAALSSIFSGAAPAAAPGNGGQARRSAPAMPAPASPMQPAQPLAAAFAQTAGAQGAPAYSAPPAAPAQTAPRAATAPASGRTAAPSTAGASMDVQKLKFEIMRLETLVKKLQSDLDSERQYSRALEEHVKTLQESE